MNNTNPIGIIDTGVGGLTLVRELMESYPGENIVYFGDSANCPYGNRPQEEVFALSTNMLRFTQSKGVKAVAVACNTISALEETLAPEAGAPFFSIVSPVSAAVAQSGLEKVGVYATEFTISTQIYTRLIQARNPDIKVYGKSSLRLADMVERDESDAAVEEEIRASLGELLAAEPLSHVILGCTHYPVREDVFKRCFPDVTFINPAKEQAKAVTSFLREKGLLNPGKKGTLSVYTSGKTENFRKVIARLGIPEPSVMESITL